MAQVRERDNPSSPRSSCGAADSFKGTPETRLTAFSPEDGSAKSSKLLHGLARSASATPPVGRPLTSFCGSATHIDKDPFVTPSHQPGTRLSPTASTFSPFSTSLKVGRAFDAAPIAAALSSDLGLSRHLHVSSSAHLSVTEVNTWLSELEARGDPPCGARFSDPLDGQVCVHFSDIRDARSTTASARHAGKDWKVEYLDPSQLAKYGLACRDSKRCSSGQVDVLAAVPQGTALDVIQAMEAVQRLLQCNGRLFAFVRRSTFPNGSFKAMAEFCDASAAELAASSLGNIITSEGIHLLVSPHLIELSDGPSIMEAFQSLSMGRGRSGVDQHQAPDTTASRLAGPMDMRIHPTFAMYPLMFQPQFAAAPTGMSYVLDSFIPSGTQGPMTPMAPVSPSYSVAGPLYHTPPSPALTSQNSFSPSRSLTDFGRSDARRQHAMRINRSPYHNVASHHNHVDILRIRDGIDVRTTIMLRNIPNKVDQAMLKRIIDESSWGKYDFMYLRIDFANDCNVGYAFINFVDVGVWPPAVGFALTMMQPLDIIDKFVDARGNQRWNCFKSDKVAEISYATIQGKDCLVQKFRNSSVMLEAPHYRPKLYFTSNGPMPELAGQEEPFPEPDNQSKMKRSCENAEHVGLFTPNAGQHFRDEQRRRRSQYDRGTRLAALEEYDYETAIQNLYGTPT
ncbi:hypothetical protein CDD81_4667 [Ophiocordyceps australis]|uniref:Mei2-like C-terminal RNA recognition motif domain-containing protein n=1 Tax=Ophiocordyceps australis TaxID=1399860 RepID=A0A2C5XTI8_9HYPO|nr:hypothetical protein CDD81_4667 [Ophiocordyceps australis]